MSVERYLPFWEAELYRIRGDLNARAGGSESESEADYARAIELSRARGAHSMALRAALSLARFRASNGRQGEAAELLRPIYASFTEGFDTRDLVDARSLLDELG